MIEYFKSIIDNFPEEIMVIQTSPAPDHLLIVRNKALAKSLPEEQVRAFYHATAQLLFLSATVRHNIQPATAFFDNAGEMSR